LASLTGPSSIGFGFFMVAAMNAPLATNSVVTSKVTGDFWIGTVSVPARKKLGWPLSLRTPSL
jgi:hypothetical protein